MPAEPSAAGVRRLALFPLNLVLFPGGLLPLRIFEPRYLRMVSECLREDRPFVVAAIIDGPEAGGVALTARRGTIARIIDWEQGEEGLLHLVCEGGACGLIGDVEVEPDRLLRADITPLPGPRELPLPAGFEWLAELLDEVLEKIGPPFDRLRRPDPGADHVAARLIELLPLPIAEKIALFELDDAGERLRRLAGLLQPDAG